LRALTSISPLSLHDALPIYLRGADQPGRRHHLFPRRPEGEVLSDEPPRRTSGDGPAVVGRRTGRGGLRPPADQGAEVVRRRLVVDRKSTRLNSSHVKISYAV